MNSRLAVVLFSLTLLLSASLLFIIQPMFSKLVLPLLGGTPQVWNTAMLFFQLLLLAGYAYAHLTSKFLTIRTQAMLHIGLLIAFFFILPIALPEGWEPPVDQDPTWWQLSLMALTVGGPFFVISGSAPMLQHWFSGTDHKDAHNPYFLYGASNLGSIAALLLYPLLIEPSMDLGTQSQSWMYGYIGLFFLILLCALVVWKTKLATTIRKTVQSKEVITWSQRFKWLLLAFIPSSLMLGVTSYVTTDVASVPLLWILPLALYISTFIIVFARKKIISERGAIDTFDFLLVFILVASILSSSMGIVFVIFHFILFFFAALVCHMALASLKPSAENLTEFYLIMSIGGALGGVFNGLITPHIFTIPLEYPLVLGLAACMRFVNQKQEKPKPLHLLLGILAVVAFPIAISTESTVLMVLCTAVVLAGMGVTLYKRWIFGLVVTLLLLISPLGGLWSYINSDSLYQERNFFGVMKVVDMEENKLRLFYHGTTIHGAQSLEKKEEHTHLAYYSSSGPIGNMFKFMDQQEANTQKVGIMGLGVGATACFYKQGRSFDFYEIDPGVIKVAENPEYFTYLSGCGSPYTIVPGDARLKLAKMEDARYDFILADAYSSDNIPMHLITAEAVALYLQKLKPNGFLGFNITNRYLDIEPVLVEISNSLGIPGYAKLTKRDDEKNVATTHGFVFARNEQQEKFLQENGWTPARKRKGVALWTDSFSNIISVFGIHSTKARLAEKNDE